MQFDPLPPSDPPAPTSDGPAAADRGRLRALSLRPATWPRWLRWTAPVLLAAAGGAIAGVGFAAAIHVPKVDGLDESALGQVTRLFDRNGDLLSSYARERRILLRDGEIPPLLQQAVLAAEDRNFMHHGGVDAVGVVRAVLANLRSGERGQGASTLTMQLARGLFLNRQKTWRRKIEEAFLAVELEKTYTKPQLLALYCNLVFVGEGNYGMQAASRYYFGKDVAELEVAEAATLAGIVQRPSAYNPYDRPDLVIERRGYVLRRMREDGHIDDATLAAALAAPLEVVQRQLEDDSPSAYFNEDVRQELVANFGSDAVLERGLQVSTTLDPAMQEAAHAALRAGLERLDRRRGWRGPIRHLDEPAAAARRENPPLAALRDGAWVEGLVLSTDSAGAEVQVGRERLRLDAEGTRWTGRRPGQLLEPGDLAWFRVELEDEGGTPALELAQEPELQGALVAIESATGAIRALVGGWDFDQTKFNRATQAERQVGSAFKPFVYGAALEAGFTPADTLLDSPVALQGARASEPYRPRNYSRSFGGILTLQHALENSVNVPAVKLLDLVGIPRVIDFTHRFGITAELAPYPSLALGSADIKPIELAAAYAAIANQGVYIQPYRIESVADPTGRELLRHHASIRHAASPQVAAVLTDMLQGVVTRGTARRAASLGIPIAGKTGTTNDYSDAWFVGFTPQYSILTWVGYDARRSLGEGMTGGAAALPIWIDFVERGLETGWVEKGGAFELPAGVVRVAVDASSGLLPGEGGGPVIEMAFLEGSEPTRPVDARWARVLHLPWFQQAAFYLPKQGERMPETPGTATGDEDGDAASAATPDRPLVGVRQPAAG